MSAIKPLVHCIIVFNGKQNSELNYKNYLLHSLKKHHTSIYSDLRFMLPFVCIYKLKIASVPILVSS